MALHVTPSRGTPPRNIPGPDLSFSDLNDGVKEVHYEAVSIHEMNGAHASETRFTEPSYKYECNGRKAYLEIELPGVAKDDISVEVRDPVLIVSGERYSRREGSLEEEEDEKDRARLSVVYSKEFLLDKRADLNAIKADCQGDGILRLEIPNKEKIEASPGELSPESS